MPFLLVTAVTPHSGATAARSLRASGELFFFERQA
jgi:hypothetical protein